MSLVKDISKFFKSNPILVVGFILVIVALFYYSNQKGNIFSGMSNNTDKKSTQSNDSNNNTTIEVQPADPIGLNEGPGSATGMRTITSGIPENCLNKATLNPNELLPKDQNEWGELNPSQNSDFKDMNLLDAGHHIGVDSVGSALRNANLQLRSEPPNPQTQVSPWLNSTIEPDLIRRPLDCP